MLHFELPLMLVVKIFDLILYIINVHIYISEQLLEKYFGMLAKVGISFILAIQVFTFTIMPYYYSSLTTNKTLLKIFNNFSAGLFMGIAFLHIIPEANEKLKAWFGQQQQHLEHGHSHAGHDHSLPLGTLISLVVFMLILGLEVYFHDGHCGQEGQMANNHQHRHQMQEVLFNDRAKMRRRLVFQTYLTQLALSVHSFFQCMSIGIEKDQSVAIVFASAIIFHKWAEGFTLGFSYANSGMPKSTALKFAAFHALLNGSAVLIGIQLSQSNEFVEGTANAISGGTFIYISMIEKINKSFNTKTDLIKKLSLVFAGLGFSILILH